MLVDSFALWIHSDLKVSMCGFRLLSLLRVESGSFNCIIDFSIEDAGGTGHKGEFDSKIMFIRGDWFQDGRYLF